jgi:outer membrane receptor protein involved in Fe transport
MYLKTKTTMYNKSITLILLTLLLSCSMVAAKNNGVISGKVIEKENGKALPYATISLHDLTEKVIGGTTSSDDGTFKINNLSAGECKVKVSFIGFKDTTFTVKIEENGNSVDLGILALAPDAVALKSAVVTAKVPVIEQKLDKIVMNVSEAVSTQGSNALDILKKAPGVSIDPSGNILLNGSAVQVWIDGRPSNLSGQELEAMLSGTDGSNIDKIEIIAHPSSKYDAAGSGGIINIKTKKNFAKGLSGSVRGSYNIAENDKIFHGTDGTLNLNYRGEKTNTSISYSPRYNQGFERMSTFTNMGSGVTLDGISDLRFDNTGQTLRISNDYFANKKNIFGFIVTGMLSDGNLYLGEKSGSLLKRDGVLLEKTVSDIDGNDEFDYINTNLNYTRIFKEGQELTLNADYGYYDITKSSNQENQFYDINETVTRTPVIFRSNSLQYINILSFKIDYEQIMFKKYKVETGLKWARSITDNNLLREDFTAGSWVKNNQLSSLFMYNEDISAAYISAARQINEKISVKAGLRAEITEAKGEWISADTVSSKSYINLFPTLFLGYNPNKNLRFGLSYTLRVRRPNFRQLNPFRMYIDASNAIEGNPDLDPQYSNQISLSLGIKQHFSIALNGQFTDNAIIQSPYFNSQTGEKLIVWENFGKQNFMGASFSVTEYPVTKWLNLNANVFLASLSNSSGDYKSESLFSQAYMNTTFILPKNYKVEMIGTFQSGLPYGYFTVKPSGELSLGVKKGVMQNKGTISLMVNDILNTQNTRIRLDDGSIEEYTLRNNYKSQRVTITFSLRFGQAKAIKKRKVGELEEGSRVGTSN